MKQTVKRKNYYLDETKIKGAQKILETKTETETIDRALDLVLFRKKILDSLRKTRRKGSMKSEEFTSAPNHLAFLPKGASRGLPRWKSNPLEYLSSAKTSV